MSITMIGLDTAKSVFQVHGVNEAGKVAIRRRLRRSELIPFFEQQPACIVIMEACGGAHHCRAVQRSIHPGAKGESTMQQLRETCEPA
jgi:transposase